MWNSLNRFVCRNYSISSNYPSSNAIRKSFIDYFVEKNGHTFIPSSSVKTMDRSLPFTNAGMNQFSDIFLGDKTTNIKKAANFQKCIRIGGKHNDLELVGYDGYHHTFFEMLGNWSFNDYYKEKACKLALDYLEKECKLSKSSMRVTYFAGNQSLKLAPDNECREIWLKLGFKDDQIKPLGINENFWEMGVQGPCGPSTEILFNLKNDGNDNWVEIWNLVFLKYNRLKNSRIIHLKNHFVDTGMGFERLVAILQNKSSTYDTDVFSHLFQTIEKVSNKKYGGKYDCEIDTAYRILVDYSRMITISLADSIIPNTSPLLRKIMRKAFEIAEKFTTNPNQLIINLCYQNVEYFSEYYPDMSYSFQKIRNLIEDEYVLNKHFYSALLAKWKKKSIQYPDLNKYDDQKDYSYLNSFLHLKRIENLKIIDGKLALYLYENFAATKYTIETLAKNLQLSFNVQEFEHELKKHKMKIKSRVYVDIDPSGL